jgi:hypothetical protein
MPVLAADRNAPRLDSRLARGVTRRLFALAVCRDHHTLCRRLRLDEPERGECANIAKKTRMLAFHALYECPSTGSTLSGPRHEEILGVTRRLTKL